ncbi:MAG: adenylate/guanylate cyclase domain-containing protein [Alphaproteobacteria bacterium]
MKPRKRRIGIAVILIVSFGGLVAVSTGALLFLAVTNALDNTKTALANRLQGLIEEAAFESERYFEPMEIHARWLAKEIAEGRIDINDTNTLVSTLSGALSTIPQAAAVSFQDRNGDGFFYESAAKDLHRVHWKQEWRVRMDRPPIEGLWVLRPSVLDGARAGTFIAPARTPTGDVGAVAVRADIAPLSGALAMDASYRGYDLIRFLLFNNRIVVGHPLLANSPELNRPTIDELGDPYLMELFESKRYDLTLVDQIPGVDTFVLRTRAGDRVFALMTDKSRKTGGEVLIGVHFDPAAGTTEVKRLILVIAVGAALLLISVIVAILLGKRAAAPVRRLATAANLVRNNELDKVENLPIGPVSELADAAEAFNGMVEGLRERARIRDLFGKYVPQDVAAMLLNDDSAGQPHSTVATVLFLDLAGFSTMSEQLDPAGIVATLNEFFSDAVAAIEKHHGMVTQFQGDAILAVFNVPVALPDHEKHAIATAREIAATVAGRDYAGQKLTCRIGINTGTLVAGAVGAAGRLNYTVHGDAVNIAARLESMNKDYGTTILVSETTVDTAEGSATFRQIGSLPIRGREKPVCVYTIDD